MTNDKKDVDSFVDEDVVLSAAESRLLAAFPEIQSMDPEAVTERLATKVRKATDLDGLFDALSGKTSDELVGKTIKVETVAWQRYETAEGATIPLAVVNAVDVVNGDALEFATTGRMMVEFLHRAQQLNVIPFTARIEGKRTSNGQTALNFVRA